MPRLCRTQSAGDEAQTISEQRGFGIIGIVLTKVQLISFYPLLTVKHFQDGWKPVHII